MNIRSFLLAFSIVFTGLAAHAQSFQGPATITQPTTVGHCVQVSATGSNSLIDTGLPCTGPVITVQAFGAKGDGSTDDTSSEQAAITYAQTNGYTLTWPYTGHCYNTSSTLNVTAPASLNIIGDICLTVGSIPAVKVTSSNVLFLNANITGFQHATYNDVESGIVATGTFNAGLAPTNISNVVIYNANISNFGGFGIELEYVDGFVISNPLIQNVGYTGIGGISALDGRVINPYINGVTATGDPSGNAYGIAWTRQTTDAGDLVSQPRSAYISTVGGVVQNVPTWQCLDTHAGSNISFVGMLLYKCNQGIFVTYSNDHTGAGNYAPLEVTVSGNVTDSGVTDGSAGVGINFIGAPTSGELATGTVSGNTVVNYGSQATSTTGAMLVNYTKGLTISGNSFVYPSSRGIVVNGHNSGLVISNNSFVDPWSNTSVRVSCTYSNSTNNDYTFSGNSCVHVDKVASFLITTASGVMMDFGDTGGASPVNIGINRSQATGETNNIGNVTLVGIPTYNGAQGISGATCTAFTNGICTHL